MTPTALLKFQERIISAMEDPASSDLLILARGLGLRRIVCSLLKLYLSSGKLVVLVGASNLEEDQSIGSQLSTMGVRNPGLRVVGHEMDKKVRQELYRQSGLVSVTSRILVVDLLAGNLPTSLLGGMVVMHAEKVSPSSTEAFIVRLYRKSNTTGFLKAFTDEPEYFTDGLFPLQTVMNELHLRSVHIYPRFHQWIQDDLERRKADIIELFQPLNSTMRDIHNAIVQCISDTLADLKKSNTTLDLDDLKIENTYFRSFDSLVRRQLDPVWHKVAPKTKQLVADLATLRRLLTYLLSYDPITFLSYLETIKSASVVTARDGSRSLRPQVTSPWLMSDSANVIFAAARRRCYIYNNPNPKETARRSFVDDEQTSADAWEVLDEIDGRTPSPCATQHPHEAEGWKPWMPSGMQPVLEELPKWNVLLRILEEIENTMSSHPAPFFMPGCNVTLIMTADQQACTLIKDLLSHHHTDRSSPSRALLESRLRLYLFWRKRLLDADSPKTSDATPLSAGTDTSQINEALRRKDATRSFVNRSRRRARGGAPPATNSDGLALDDTGDLVGLLDPQQELNLPDDVEEQPGFPLPVSTLGVKDRQESTKSSEFDQQIAAALAFDEDELQNSDFGVIQPEQLIVVRAYGNDSDDMLLSELRPRWIVMYDPNQDFLRRIEVYRATHAGLALRIYFLSHHETSEEQRLLVGVRREKEAFERLINERGKMHLVLDAQHSATTSHLLATINSRNAGGQKSMSAQHATVLVDLREFRSSLPNLLDKMGQRVVPLTLTVGDYILTPDICVERKSLPDLVQSFSSGRLYSQCELMSVHYKQPVLLIEFEENKSFSLQSLKDNRTGPRKTADVRARQPLSELSTSKIEPQSIQTRLVILTLAFPRLKIVWSASPHATASIFSDLKANNLEPDPKQAAAKGTDETVDESTGDNLTAEEVLRSLPGIGTKNYRYVMGKVGSMRELCEMELASMQLLLGVEPGKTCYEFLHAGERQAAVLV